VSFRQSRSPRFNNPLAAPPTVAPSTPLFLPTGSKTLVAVARASQTSLLRPLSTKLRPPVVTNAPSLPSLPPTGLRRLVAGRQALEARRPFRNSTKLRGRTTQAAGFISDNFNDNAQDVAKWTTFGSGVAETNQRLEMTTVLAGQYMGYQTLGSNYDLTASGVYSQLINAGNQALASLEAYPALVILDTNNQLFWLVAGGQARAYTKIGGVNTQIASIPYDPALHLWFRIREAGGTIFWDYATSPNAGWTNLATLATPFSVAAVALGLQTGTWAAEATTTTVVYDSFNLVPALFLPTGAHTNVAVRSHQNLPVTHSKLRPPVVTSTLTPAVLPTGVHVQTALRPRPARPRSTRLRPPTVINIPPAFLPTVRVRSAARANSQTVARSFRYRARLANAPVVGSAARLRRAASSSLCSRLNLTSFSILPIVKAI
jgi:hypothetical protein